MADFTLDAGSVADLAFFGVQDGDTVTITGFGTTSYIHVGAVTLSDLTISLSTQVNAFGVFGPTALYNVINSTISIDFPNGSSLTPVEVTNISDNLGFFRMIGAGNTMINNAGHFEIPRGGIVLSYGVVEMLGAGSSFVNHGTLDASPVDNQPLFFVSTPSGRTTIENTGLMASGGNIIEADNTAVTLKNSGEFYGSVVLSDHDDLIENSYALIGDIWTHGGNDHVINSSVLSGNLHLGAGNDIFDGRGGHYSIYRYVFGGTGDDTYHVDDGHIAFAGINLSENADEGTDKVFAGMDWTLGANFEHLFLREAAISGTGNGLNNRLTGNAGDNVLSGLEGDDLLAGNAGADTLYGGDGVDKAVYRNSDAGIFIHLEFLGSSFLSPNGGHATGDMLYGIEGIIGSGFDDTLYGDAGANMLAGLGGADSLSGGLGNDFLRGGDGDDILTGGAGRDRMSGGAGADVFLFQAIADSPDGNGTMRDVILDFTSTEDTLDLSALADDPLVYLGSGAFTGTGVAEVRTLALKASGSTIVRVDVDGDGQADLGVTLQGTALITMDDLLL